MIHPFRAEGIDHKGIRLDEFYLHFLTAFWNPASNPTATRSTLGRVPSRELSDVRFGDRPGRNRCPLRTRPASTRVSGSNLAGEPVPTSILQLFFPRFELHVFYNSAITIPTAIAMWSYIRCAAHSVAPGAVRDRVAA